LSEKLPRKLPTPPHHPGLQACTLEETPQLAFFRDLDWPDSDIAIAIACLRLFTFRPEPLYNLPFLCSCITFSTFFFCWVDAMIRLLCH
jgi:hypothetical protein